MASGPITSWQIDGETRQMATNFIFLGSKITVNGDCNHEIERHLLLRRKPMTNLDNILKIRDITDKGPSSQSYGFSSSHVWMWELYHKESWAVKNWCFELCHWRKLFRVSWTGRRSNQSIWKDTNPEYSLEGLTLKLRLQYFGHLMQITDSLEKTLYAGKDWRQKEKGMAEEDG